MMELEISKELVKYGLDFLADKLVSILFLFFRYSCFHASFSYWFIITDTGWDVKDMFISHCKSYLLNVTFQ